MSRLIAVGLTEAAVVSRTKTVTRRLGWWKDKNGFRIVHEGDHLTACRKVMGRRPGEPLVRLAEVELVAIRREPLWQITPADVVAEGVPLELFPELDPATGQPSLATWVDWYCREMGVHRDTEVTRLEWTYLGDPPAAELEHEAVAHAR